MSKEVIYGLDSRLELAKGIDKVANAVKVTLGPNGKNVVFNRPGDSVIITKDGVTVAKEIELDDELQNTGAQLMKDVASKTNKEAGDGTTTATILAQALFTNGLRYTRSGINPIELKRGMDITVDRVVKYLESISKPIEEGSEDVRRVATISANNDDEIGNLIYEAVTKAGKDGIVSFKESKTGETHIKQVDGLQIDKGYMKPYFITDPNRMVAEYDDPKFLLVDGKISNVRDLINIMNQVGQNGISLVIMADDIDDQIVNMMVFNKLNQGFKVVLVKTPGYGDDRTNNLSDLAALTSATIISDEKGLKLSEANLNHLGSANRITITSDTTTVICNDKDNDRIKRHIENIKHQIDDSEITEVNKNKLKSRLMKLTTGAVTINIAATSEVDMKEKRDRYDDSLNATVAALKGGILPGGGTAYLRAINYIESQEKLEGDRLLGSELILKILEAPLKQILENSGIEKNDTIISEVLKTADNVNYGYNARTREFVDMMKEGVIDPTKVEVSALKNAVSMIGLLLTTECVIYQKKEENESCNYHK